jgi:hypothetical protein
VYKGCLEDIGDDLRPSITKTVHELEHVFKLYGIEADIETEWQHDVFEVRARLKGYSEVTPMEVGQLLLAKVVDASMSRSYKDRERLTFKLISTLYAELSMERLIELVKSLDKGHIRITRTLDNYSDVRRYEMVIEHEDIKIELYVTEEKEGNYWTISDIAVGSIGFKEVADLTPA